MSFLVRRGQGEKKEFVRLLWLGRESGYIFLNAYYIPDTVLDTKHGLACLIHSAPLVGGTVLTPIKQLKKRRLGEARGFPS